MTERIAILMEQLKTKSYEPIFLYLMSKKSKTKQKADLQKLRNQVENAKKRVLELDKIISHLYEDNILGKLSDERYAKMSAAYETEQKELNMLIANGEKEVFETEQKTTDLRLLLKTLREMTDFRELTPEIVNTLIQRIEVHNNDKYDGHCHVKVDIYFTAVGLIDIPTENEIKELLKEIEAERKAVKSA